MTLIRILLRVAVLGLSVAAMWTAPVAADDISPAQMQAALDAITATRGARGLDNVLPLLSDRTQNQLIRARPDLHKEIADVVEATALKLAVRRNDLDNDVARIWAKNFNEDELKTIAAFFKSPAGQKYLDVAPRVVTDSMQAVKGWSDRVGEELLEKSREELKKQGFDF